MWLKEHGSMISRHSLDATPKYSATEGKYVIWLILEGIICKLLYVINMKSSKWIYIDRWLFYPTCSLLFIDFDWTCYILNTMQDMSLTCFVVAVKQKKKKFTPSFTHNGIGVSQVHHIWYQSESWNARAYWAQNVSTYFVLTNNWVLLCDNRKSTSSLCSANLGTLSCAKSKLFLTL